MGLPAYVLEETPQGPTARSCAAARAAGGGAFPRSNGRRSPTSGSWAATSGGQARVFTKGPFRHFGPVFDLEPVGLPDGAVGSKVSYALDWEPLTLMGRLFGARLARQAGEVVGKRILEAAAFAKGARATHFDLAPPELPQGARERAAALAAEIDRSPYGNGLGRPLADRVLGAMATDLLPLKPKPLARELDVPQRDAIEGCLAGVRAGLLTMKWDLLCTNCRGAKVSTSVLSELPRGAHCPSCNIDYGRDFEKNVELSFAPAPTVRPLSAGGFCLSGSMATCRNVAVQLLLAPGETRRVTIDLPPGQLPPAHAPSHGDHVDVEHDPRRGRRRLPRPAGHRAWRRGHAARNGGRRGGSIAFANDAGFELAALIEDRSWTRDALTAPEVISALQVFRDLFAEATLRPGDEAGCQPWWRCCSPRPAGLRRRSTRAWWRRRRGLQHGARALRPAGAYRSCKATMTARWSRPSATPSHGLVRRSRGWQVKAALAMQARIADHDLVLTLGVHVGPSVVVTLNDRLDYFGSTVNMAARLQGQSDGGDIVLSRAVADDPAVRPQLAPLAARDESVPLKGFADPISFVRLLPSAAQ